MEQIVVSSGPWRPQGALLHFKLPHQAWQSTTEGPMIVLMLINSLTHCPHLHGMINTGRCKQLSIRRPGDGRYITGVTSIGKDVISRESIPDLHYFIVASRSDISAIRRPCYGIQSCGNIAVDDKFLACRRIPHLHTFVIAYRGDTLSVRRPDQSVYSTGMALIAKLAA